MTAITLISAVVLTLVTFTAADSWFPGFLLPCVKVCPDGWRCEFSLLDGQERCVRSDPGIKPGWCPWLSSPTQFATLPFGPFPWKKYFCSQTSGTCSRDTDCPNDLKCCNDRCGRRTCQSPWGC